MFLPVDKSISVSPPHLTDQRIFSTSSSMEDATALLPMLVLILTRKLRPMIIGSSSGWLMLAGMMARPRATSLRTNSGVISRGIAAPNERPACWCQRESRGGLAGAAPASLRRLEPGVFADGDVFHLGRDDSLARVMQLRDDFPRLRAEHGAVAAIEYGELVFRAAQARGGGVGLGKVAVVGRAVIAPGDFLDIAAFANPGRAHGRQAALDIAVEIRIAPRAGSVVNADWFVDLDGAVGPLGRRQGDFAHRHAQVRARAGNIDAPRRRKQNVFALVLTRGAVLRCPILGVAVFAVCRGGGNYVYHGEGEVATRATTPSGLRHRRAQTDNAAISSSLRRC